MGSKHSLREIVMVTNREDNILAFQIELIETIKEEWSMESDELAHILNKYNILSFVCNNYDKFESVNVLEVVEDHIVNQGGCIYNSLTPWQIQMRFDYQTVGLANIQFNNKGGILTADVVYSNYSEKRQQRNTNNNIIAYSPDDLKSADNKATTKEEALIIFSQYNIKVEEVESSVFKVLNPEEIFVNLEEFCYEFERILLLTSEVEHELRNDKTYRFANIYYILLDLENPQTLYKYATLCNSERKTIILRFEPETPTIEAFRQWKEDCKKENFRKNHEEVMKIFKRHGLQIERVETSIYKVLNPHEQIVCISDIGWSLEYAAIITDFDNEVKMQSNWSLNDAGYIYYISLDINDYETIKKYRDIVEETYNVRSNVDWFDYKPKEDNLFNLWVSQGIE